MSTRAPVPDAPPAYATLPLRVYKNDMRPVVMICTAFATIWGLAIGVQFIKDMRDGNSESPPFRRCLRILRTSEADAPRHLSSRSGISTTDTSALKTFYLVLAILYFFCAAIEAYGLGAAYTRRLRLVMFYFWASVLAAIVVSAAEILRVVIHFSYKSQIISVCVADEMDANTANDTITETQANTLCTNSWGNSTWWDIVLMLLTFVLAFLFSSIAASFAHQLANPSVLRTQAAHLAPSAAYNYPLAPYPGPSPYGQPQSDFIPPPTYAPGGPPGYDAGAGAPYASDKKEGDESLYAAPWQGQGQGQSGFGGRREAEESTETVTLEPRRENEGRV
ncbi:capsular associated protein [Pseudohyphozyma bogoriensis]|nr:capsular associated protein [Pseudohyphozyma bogoriensis]